MKLRSSIVVDAGDELVGGVYTRRGGECPKPELWVEAQKEKRLVGGEKKWAEDRSGAFAFCRCRCRSPFLYFGKRQRHSERYKVQEKCARPCLCAGGSCEGGNRMSG